jgi:2,5-diketo-D-gluconate reductase B
LRALQVEYHIGFHDDIVNAYAGNNSVVLQAYSPLAGGVLAKADANATISVIARAHNRSVAQVALRFIAQGGVAAIPKAATLDYMAENMGVFDFALTASEMVELGAAATPNRRGVSDAESMMCVDTTQGKMARCSYLDAGL